MSGGLPTSLSPRPPGTIGAGGRGTGAGGPPPGGPLPGNPPPPPGNPPPGGPPKGGLTHGFLEVRFFFLVCLEDLLGLVLLLGIGLRHLH
jgi:hypothetical protein